MQLQFVLFLCHLVCSNRPPVTSLPWQGLKAGTKKQKYEKISERKIATSTEVACVLLYILRSPPLRHYFLNGILLTVGPLSWISY